MFKDFVQDGSIKNRTLKTVYQLIHQNAPISKADLLDMTKLKPTTLARMIDELLLNRFIYEDGFGKSSGGRPPILYHIKTNCNYIIGVDISRLSTRVLLVDLLFQPIDKVSFPMTPKHTPEHVLSEIILIIHHFMKKYDFSLDQLLGIGIGAVGPLDRQKGMILHPESFLAQNWKNAPIIDLLKQTFPTRILLENGAKTAVLSEYAYLPERTQNILYCISGIGLRCGVMINGQVANRKIGDSSTYGHTIINIDGPLCTCGKKGCLISYISLQSILHQVVDLIDKGNHSMIRELVNDNFENVTVDHVLTAMKHGDRLTNDIIMKSALFFGIGLANMVNTLHPEYVILSGPLINENPGYYEKVVNVALDHVNSTEKETLVFRQGVLKDDAAAIGAAILIFQSYFNHISIAIESPPR